MFLPTLMPERMPILCDIHSIILIIIILFQYCLHDFHLIFVICVNQFIKTIYILQLDCARFI